MLENLLQLHWNGNDKRNPKISIDDVTYFWRHPRCIKIKIIK